MALKAVCYKCGALSQGVSPVCANKLCANFGRPARLESAPTDSNRRSPHTPDSKQFTLQTLAITMTVVAGVVALLVKIPVLAIGLLAFAGLCALPVFYVRWSQWIAAHPRLKLLAATLNCGLYLLLAITIASYAVAKASWSSALIATMLLFSAIAEGGLAVATYSAKKQGEDPPTSRGAPQANDSAQA